MRLSPIQVEAYSGAKAGETPGSFVLEDQRIKVAEVVDRWFQVESKPEWPRADYFKILGSDQHEYLLKHDLESMSGIWAANGDPRCIGGLRSELNLPQAMWMTSKRSSGKKVASAVLKRCAWAKDEFYVAYHDKEWGVPVHDDRLLFEFLILEGAQAGLSWITILKKRQNYRRAFDKFDARKVARYDASKIRKLLADAGIVRNRLKIESAVQNANSFLAVQKEFGSFDRYVWQFVGGKPIRNHWRSLKQVPPRTAESDALSKDLIKRGFKFVGSTICYAFMQAVGMVNDHTTDCFRYDK